MKNIVLLLATIPILLVSCTKDPNAGFNTSTNTPGIGEYVYFTNRSIDAESFEWDFGDGYVSNTFNSSHYYDEGGVYIVRLTAISSGKSDVANMTITVGASLEITVEEYLEPFYVVSDISVRLYPTVTDWENETSLVAEGYTNSNGVIRFDYLPTQRLYVDVWGPNHDNYKLAEEDVGWIETPVLVPGILTQFTAVVDYYPPAKKSTLNRLDLKILRKSEANESTPRKISDRK